MNDKQIVLRQPYAVTLARHRLNVHEMRIIFRVIEALQPEVKYNQNIKEIGQTLFGNKIIRLQTKYLLPEGQKNYGRVKSALESLTQRRLKVQGEDKKDGKYELYTGLILKAKYFHNNEFVELELDKDLLPSFLALAKNYSKYLLEVAFNASSPNVMKFYQFTSHHYHNKKLYVEMDIEDLRDWLQLENKYSKPKDLRKGVIEPSMKELKEKADVYFTLKEPIKVGRRITGWKIKIFKKATSPSEIESSRKLEAEIRKYLSTCCKLNMKDMVALEQYITSPEWQPHIWEAMHRVDKHFLDGTVKNKRAYTLKTLINEIEG